MLIDMFDVVSNAGKTLRKTIPLGRETFPVYGDEYPIRENSPIEVTVTNSDGRKLLIRLTGEVLAQIPCDRCLELTDVNIPLDYEREFQLEREQLIMDELDIAEFIEGLTLDTDQLVYDELLVNWPMKVLCKDDCKGICNKCGCNLNETTCDCDRTVLDPRMAAIQDVFNKFKEV